MKRIIVFLLLAALLLGGCGTPTPETEAREAQSTSTAVPGHGDARLVGAERGG